MEFEPKNRKLVIKPSGNLHDKISFIQKIYEMSGEKINHIDRLRQQLLYFAFAIFSGLSAFIIKSDNVSTQIIACIGVSYLMFAFRQIDHRYHTYLHGYTGSMFIFTQAITHLLNNPTENLELYEYCVKAEKTVEKFSLQTKIYFSLATISIILVIVFSIAKSIDI